MNTLKWLAVPLGRRASALLVIVTVLTALACKEAPGSAAANSGVPDPGGESPGIPMGPARGSAGMVSTAHPLATQAGVEVLEAGGNAFDATVAIAAALNVVEPMMSGMGGYGTILTWSASDRRARYLNPSGRIPAGVDGDAYRPPTPGYMENRTGAKAVSTPGTLNAWWAMHEEYGSLPWEALFGSAITLAREGFPVDPRLAEVIAAAWDELPEHVREFYGSDGAPLSVGDPLVQEGLASSLELIAAEGPGALHGGALGEAVDRAMREAGGFLRLSDLVENEAEWWEPIAIDYRGHRVVTASPPANAFPALIRLGMMGEFDVEAMGHNTVPYLHTFAEVTKHAFWTRLRWAGDPELSPPPLDRLLSPEYWATQAAAIDPERASEFVPPGVTGASSRNTTHFVVADRYGNVVSATQTLGNLFGSRIMPEGTGIWLNNSLAYSTFDPAGNPMDAFPGRRKLSGDVPLFVMDEEGLPWIALGTPGGHTIGQTVPQIVMNMLDFGMDIQAAIAAPRISFVEPDRIIQDGLDPEVVEGLRAMGHEVRATRAIGNAHGLTIRWNVEGRPVEFTGGSDPRGVGTARGPKPN